MTSVSFNYRASQSAGGGLPGSLFLRVIHKRKALNITTPYKIYPEEWDEVARMPVLAAVGDSPRTKHLLDVEDRMNRDRRRIEGVIAALEKEGEYTTHDVVRNFKLNTRSNTLLGYVRKLSFDLRDREQERTARAYATVARGLVRFNKGQDVRLEHINSTLIKNFERSMRESGKSLNTISYYMRNLRSIYNKAIAEQRIHARFENPFAHVYTGVHVTRKRALTKAEMQMLGNLDLTLTGGAPEQAGQAGQPGQGQHGQQDTAPLDDGLRQALGMFLFCFHARGMSFVDMAYLKKENIKKDRITYFRKKTGQLLEVRITAAMRSIIDSFGHATLNSPYVFPAIADADRSHRLQYETALRTQNARLKRLARLAGVEKTVSTHVARHSWATIAKNEQYPLAVICEGLGHSSEKTTYTYLASFERSVIDSASEAISNAIKSA